MRKRLEVLTALLKEIEERPYTEERDDKIAAMKEVIDEHEWDSSSPRKYIGMIGGYGSNKNRIETLEFDTAAGQLLFNVAYDKPELQEFIASENDIIRHKRYDISLDTDLIAHVKGTTLEKLEWKVKWNPDSPEKWFCADEAKFQYCNAIHEGEGIYEFIQPVPHSEAIWKISHSLVAMREYPKQIIQDLQKQLEHDGFITEGMAKERINLLIAKRLFVYGMAEHNGYVSSEDYTWEGATEKIIEKIGLKNS